MNIAGFEKIIKYLSISIVLIGIGLAVWIKYMNIEQVISIDAGKTAELLSTRLDSKDEQIKALTEAITALSKVDAPAKSINDALRALEQGDTKQAEAVFTEVAASKEAAGKQNNQEAAEAYRHLGALAFLNDSKAALAAYEKSTVLDPNNTEGWNWLGNLLCGAGAQEKENRACAKINLGNMHLERGELDQAEQLYKEALEDSHDIADNAGTARAVSNLGSVYFKRNELVRAEEMYKKALKLVEALGSKEGMVVNYNDLGLLYAKRGEMDKAEEMHRKALELDMALGSKKGMAQDYVNLGDVSLYRTKKIISGKKYFYSSILKGYRQNRPISRISFKTRWLTQGGKKCPVP